MSTLKNAKNPPALKPHNKRRDNGGLESDLILTEGANVMVVNNIDVDAGLANGALGTVTGLLWYNCQTNNYDTVPQQEQCSASDITPKTPMVRQVLSTYDSGYCKIIVSGCIFTSCHARHD